MHSLKCTIIAGSVPPTVLQQYCRTKHTRDAYLESYCSLPSRKRQIHTLMVMYRVVVWDVWGDILWILAYSIHKGLGANNHFKHGCPQDMSSIVSFDLQLIINLQQGVKWHHKGHSASMFAWKWSQLFTTFQCNMDALWLRGYLQTDFSLLIQCVGINGEIENCN